MKFLPLLFLISSSSICLAQSDKEELYTLEPTTSKVIGGHFSFNGSSNWETARNGTANHAIFISPYFSLNRTTKKDVLLVTEFELRTNKEGSFNSNILVMRTGIDWRHQLYQFKKFKVLGSAGPRVGFSRTNSTSSEAVNGLNLGFTGQVALAYEFTPNIRLLTGLVQGNFEYSRLSKTNFFNYRLRNSVVSPNFSIEYILPRKA